MALVRLMDELGDSDGLEELTRLAVTHAVGALGLKRAWLCLRDRRGPRIVMRGTFRALAPHEPMSDHELCREISRTDLERLASLHRQGSGYRSVPAEELGPSSHWCVETPLVARGDVMGVLYNDGGPCNEPLDEGRQQLTVVYCGLVAQYLRARRGPAIHPPGPRRREALVVKILELLANQPDVSGRVLAGDLGVSAGHVARTFRAATGVSLVEYRNRLRVHRFLELVRKRSDLTFVDAAFRAGFGNYSHFHRVFRALTGSSPKAAVQNGTPPPDLPEVARWSDGHDEGTRGADVAARELEPAMCDAGALEVPDAEGIASASIGERPVGECPISE